MNADSVTSRNRTRMLIIALAFMIINTIIILLLCNTGFIVEQDKQFWNTKIVLIINGLCFGAFFLILKGLNQFTIKKLFLIFIITRVMFLYFFIAFNYGMELDFAITFSKIPIPVLNGELFTPYTSYITDAWRIYPPMWMWWFTYNYWIYGLDETLWRIVNLLLEIGIVYAMIQIFHENATTEKGWKEENFKIGLSFYIFSFVPIVAILLYANIIAFPVLLGLLGFLFFFRSKRNPKYIYHAVFFFCLVALTEFYAAVWILGILFIVLFQKQFRRLFLLIGEILAVFCLVALPLLINDAFGFLEHIFVHYKVTSTNWDGTIWAIDWTLFNWPESISYISAGSALLLSIYYVYRNKKSEISIEFFIVIISIFLFFSPIFSAWHYLWIFPLLCLTIMFSFRKFFITNLFFLGHFLFFIIWFATAYLTSPLPLYIDPTTSYVEIFNNWMSPLGYFAVLPLIGQTIYQMGFVYLIYSYTKSKKIISGLLIAFAVYYIFNICFPANLVY